MTNGTLDDLDRAVERLSGNDISGGGHVPRLRLAATPPLGAAFSIEYIRHRKPICSASSRVVWTSGIGDVVE